MRSKDDAKAEHKSRDTEPNEQHNLLQANESRPDEPAEPWVCMAALRIVLAFRFSKRKMLVSEELVRRIGRFSGWVFVLENISGGSQNQF